MTSDEFDRMVVQGAVEIMLENNRKFLERGGMILAKEFEGELWVKASDLEKKVKQAVEAEREACAKVAEERLLDKANCTAEEMYELQKKSIAAAILARGQE